MTLRDASSGGKSEKMTAGLKMNLGELYSRLEDEFEIEIPEEVEGKLVCVRDVRDYIRECYRLQGMEMPAGLVFERLRRLVAILAKTDASAIRPETKLEGIEASEAKRAWV